MMGNKNIIAFQAFALKCRRSAFELRQNAGCMNYHRICDGIWGLHCMQQISHITIWPLDGARLNGSLLCSAAILKTVGPVIDVNRRILKLVSLGVLPCASVTVIAPVRTLWRIDGCVAGVSGSDRLGTRRLLSGPASGHRSRFSQPRFVTLLCSMPPTNLWSLISSYGLISSYSLCVWRSGFVCVVITRRMTPFE